MGFGLSGYTHIFLYVVGIIGAILSLIYNPLIGIFTFFPTLPYGSLYEKIKTTMPFGKNYLDIIFLMIFLGWLLRINRYTNNKYFFKPNEINFPIFLIVIITTFGVIYATLSLGLPFDSSNDLLIQWKEYMLLPFLFFLTANIINKRKDIIILIFLLTLGIIGVDIYFYNNLKWMNIWHFSYKVRDSFSGLFVHLGANHFGAFFAHFGFILLGIAMFLKSKVLKICLLIVIALNTYCLMYTFSRGAYLALLGGLIFLGIVRNRLLLIFLFLFLIFWRSIVPISVIERIDMTKGEDDQLEESAADRIMLWNHALDLFYSSPIIGHGFNTFECNGYRDAHNCYLLMLAELGLIGFFSFIYMCYCAFMVGWKLYKESKDNIFKGLGLGFSTCMIAVMITNFFGNRWRYLVLGAYLWIFLGLVVSALHIVRTEDSLNKT